MERSETPRISVNKLAEYIYASPVRRKTIIEDCKTPVNFIVSRYDIARPFMNRFIQERNNEILDEGLLTLNASDRSSEFKINDISNSIELLNSIRETDLSVMDNCMLEEFPKKSSILRMSGVDISVLPSHIIKCNIKDQSCIGALKVSHSKTKQLSDDSQRIVALIVKLYLDSLPEYSGFKVTERLCLSLDAFKKRLMQSPTSTKLRISNIESACEEIAARWR